MALLGETVGDEGRGPLCCKLGQGMQRHAGGGQAARVVSCLPAILGAYGRSGWRLGVQHRRRLPVGAVHLETPRWETSRLLATNNLGKNLASLDDPPVEAIVFYGANPMVSNPELELVRRGDSNARTSSPW
ncbi:MAG: hypothetical protein R2710_10780 [Acidimicrobiales bacterium]